jgi:tetratricopeptide (TPR) repeat protein
LAGSQFQKAIALDPEYTNGYLLHANLLRDQGYLNEATRLYTQALALDPLNPSIHENQALLAAYQGNHERALDQLDATAQANPGRLTGHLAASRVSVMAGDYSGALSRALAAAELAPQSPIALAALLESHLRLGNQSEARSALARMLESAPNNETAIIATMRFYLMTGDYQALDSIANARVSRFIDNPSGIGSEFLFEHVAWAATARLASGDAAGARDLLEKGVLNPDAIDPNPAAAHTLALWARALNLDGDHAGAEQMATAATQLIERAREQGWGGSQMDYVLASAAASTGATGRALEYLRKANEGGWSDFVYARHDPVMADVVNSSGFKELAGDRLQAD